MAGALFFRIRSFAPLPVIALALSLTWRPHVHPGPGGEDVDRILNFVGFASCALGALIRFITIGLVPAGTSSQSRQMHNHALNTTGPYAVVRHPLYLGNFFITLGLLLIAHEPWAYALGLGYFFLTHLLIIRAEEALLRNTFKAEYDEWASRVPALVPKLSALGQVKGSFDWVRAVQREVNPFVGWGMGATLLVMWELFARSELTAQLGKRGLLSLGLFLLMLVVNKIWKIVRRRRGTS
jgi:protein-S-isoprenylcysteine O-methyltransferase Ste14